MPSGWHDAAIGGDVTLLKRLVLKGEDVDGMDRYGQTAVMLAAVHGHRAVVEMLIDSHADLDVTAKYGLSALMLAIVNGHVGVAEALVNAGADLDIVGRGAPGFAGKTAGDLATDRGFADLAAMIRQEQP